jgi:hypothetical protein
MAKGASISGLPTIFKNFISNYNCKLRAVKTQEKKVISLSLGAFGSRAEEFVPKETSLLRFNSPAKS